MGGTHKFLVATFIFALSAPACSIDEESDAPGRGDFLAYIASDGDEYDRTSLTTCSFVGNYGYVGVFKINKPSLNETSCPVTAEFEVTDQILFTGEENPTKLVEHYEVTPASAFNDVSWNDGDEMLAAVRVHDGVHYVVEWAQIRRFEEESQIQGSTRWVDLPNHIDALSDAIRDADPSCATTRMLKNTPADFRTEFDGHVLDFCEPNPELPPR